MSTTRTICHQLRSWRWCWWSSRARWHCGWLSSRLHYLRAGDRSTPVLAWRASVGLPSTAPPPGVASWLISRLQRSITANRWTDGWVGLQIAASHPTTHTGVVQKHSRKTCNYAALFKYLVNNNAEFLSKIPIKYIWLLSVSEAKHSDSYPTLKTQDSALSEQAEENACFSNSHRCQSHGIG